MNWPLHVHSTEISGNGDVSQLLQTLARLPGDMVLLHEAPNGRAVIAVNPLIAFSAWRQGTRCRVVLDTVPELKQSNFERIPTDPIDPSEVLNLWESILSGASFSGAQIPAELFGWMGFIGYELGVMLELPDLYADHDATLPLLHWQLFSRYFIFDPQRGVWNLIYLDRPDAEIKTVDKVWSQMRNILNVDRNATPEINSAVTDLEIIQTPDKSHFYKIFRKCLDYIAAGDIYQANLSEEWLVRTTISPCRIYQNMIALSPAAYCAFVRFGEHIICSISPELFIARRGDELLTQPIKGTRSRHLNDPVTDNRNRDDLLQSPKDRSELAMIVDLLRNDLGKVCIPGSVRVIDRRRMEAHPTVWHTSAQITGTLKSGLMSGWAALVAGVCPGGSISGVPKIRAMEIITELERRPRGIYCGNIGWIHPNGDGVLNIAIRTLHIFRNVVRISAGSGIVAESDPEEEFAEIHAKAFALLKALYLDIHAPITR